MIEDCITVYKQKLVIIIVQAILYMPDLHVHYCQY